MADPEDVARLVGQLEKIIGAAETKTMPYSYSPDWVYLHAMDCLAVVESQTARIATLEAALRKIVREEIAPGAGQVIRDIARRALASKEVDRG